MLMVYIQLNINITYKNASLPFYNLVTYRNHFLTSMFANKDKTHLHLKADVCQGKH